MSPQLPLLLNATATLAMAGVIWFVQIVHYPLFPFAAGNDFARFSAAHQRRTTWVVAPLMLAELAAATWLLLPSSGAPRGPAVAGWLLVAAIWLLTAAINVPLHRRLSRGFDPVAARRLVRGNWLRTAAWTVRAVLAVRLLDPELGSTC